MTFMQLDDGDRQLLSLMQSVDYGRLEKLSVRGGHAVVTADTRKIRSRKIGAANHPHGLGAGGDFLLNAKQEEFLAAVRETADGIINQIQIQAGLPVSFETEETAII